jgi:Mg2+/Co2+ transporter CorB
MSLEIGLIVFAILILLALSAFFNGSETALTAASRARMHALEQEGDTRATTVNGLMAAPEKMLGAVLLGTTLFNVLGTALAAALATELVGEVGVIYATVVMTSLIFVFAAVLPKTYALTAPERAALLVAPILRAIIRFLTPFTLVLQFVVRTILKLTPSTKDDAANILAAHEEIRGAIELREKEGAVARNEAAMLGGVLDLGDLMVADIMVHRTKMATMDIDRPTATIIDAILKSGFSRVPVWRDEPENIVGLLYAKDILAALAAVGFDLGKIDHKTLVQTPWFVPDTTRAKDQLGAFLKKKSQMALVVDEYGEVQGLVTLEDILEEIVGDIADEHDGPEAGVRLQADGSINVDGTYPIRDLNRRMDWDLPDEEATTIAGLLIHEAQSIPEPGQAFTFHGYRFEVLRKNRNKLTALRIRPIAPGAKVTAAPRGSGERDAMDGG